MIRNIKTVVRNTTTASGGKIGVPSTRESSVAVNQSNLPPPAHSGIGWIRENNSVESTRTIKKLGTKEKIAPSALGNRMLPSIGIKEGEAITIRRELSNPNHPTTTEALHRLGESPANRVSRLSKRLPDIGGAALWHGYVTNPNAASNGIPTHPKPVNHIVGKAIEMGRSNVSVSAALRQSIKQVRKDQKVSITVSEMSPSGLDIAMSPRLVPDTPSGRREAIRDIKPKLLHGRQIQHITTPESVVDATAVARALPPTRIPMSLEALSTMGAQSKLNTSEAPAPAVKPTNVANPNLFLLVAVGIAALVIFRA